ncbi:MAG: hypothetical protein ACHQT5_01930 [Candidatus Saccharimonadales bacterium]|jgi:hypothetical protein
MPATKSKKTTKKIVSVAQPTVKQSARKPAAKVKQSVTTPIRKKLPSGFTLLVRTFRLLMENIKLLGGILLVYALVDLIFVGGDSTSTSLPAAKESLSNLFHGHISSLATGFTLFSFLAGSANTASTDAASAYEAMILLVISVVFIWALRQVYAQQKVRIRDAFYTGTFPIIPYLLVLLVMGIQLLPFVIGAALYSNLLQGGYLVGPLQHYFAIVVLFLLAAWSLYMLCASIIALYIVTLPDMTPLKALKSARELVKFRRWVVLRKLLFLIAVVGIADTLILIPVAVFVTPIAMLLFLLLTALTVGVVHSYIYGLYREML